MKKMIVRIILLLLLLNMSVVYAEDNVSFYDKAKKYSSDVVDSSIQSFGETKKYSVEAFESTKNYSKETWDGAKNYTNETMHYLTTDDITFESFYKESSSIGWITAGVIAAIAAVTITVVTLGAAAPVIAAASSAAASVGSALGGIMGLSGAAATNAGLALLGGGSLAAGGLGMAGGVAVVVSALTFGTAVTVDYATSKALTEYSYSNFAKKSKNMITLPIPKNTDGCDTYEEAIEVLQDIDEEKPLSSEFNQDIVNKSIEVLNNIITDNIDDDEKAKKESLHALLYFISNDYRRAKKHAGIGIESAKSAKVKYTMPSYIYATSSLYDDTINLNQLVEKLKYSMINEADNPLIPLLLSIHLDRMMYRFGDGLVGKVALNEVFKIASDESIKDFRLQNYLIVLSRYAIRLKLEQQKISSLATTDNKTIRNSSKTLVAVKESFNGYTGLIKGSKNVLISLSELEFNEEESESKKQVDTFSDLIAQYDNDKNRLKDLIEELEVYQVDLTEEERIKTNTKEFEVVNDNKNIYLYIGLSIVLLVLMMFFIFRRDNSSDLKTKN